jgi:hypothetical protein
MDGQYRERAATDAEMRSRNDWQSFAMECLEDEEISHCGHLDSATIVDGCTYCAQWTTHAKHSPSSPDPQCVDCAEWRRSNEESRRILDYVRRYEHPELPDILHTQLTWCGEPCTLVGVCGEHGVRKAILEPAAEGQRLLFPSLREVIKLLVPHP